MLNHPWEYHPDTSPTLPIWPFKLTCAFNCKIISIAVVFLLIYFLRTLLHGFEFTVYIIHYACFPHISTIPLYISTKFLLLLLYLMYSISSHLSHWSWYNTIMILEVVIVQKFFYYLSSLTSTLVVLEAMDLK